MKNSTRRWLKGMIRAFIKGGSGAVAGGAGAAMIAPDQFNPMTQTGHFFELSGVVFAVNGAHELFQFLKDNPVPDDDTQFIPKTISPAPTPENNQTSNTMKTPLIAILISLCVSFSSKAQTLDHVPDLLGTNSPITVNGALGKVWTAFRASDIMQATNYAIAPYVTYAPKAPEKIGGGILAIYNVNNYVGAALGVDYLGSFSLVSGNLTLKADTQPLASITWLSWAPDVVRNVTITPFSLLGVGTPLGGTSGQGAATIWDVGGMIKFGHLFGGRFGAGVTWGEWMNAGDYSGHRYHGFVDWQKGF